MACMPVPVSLMCGFCLCTTAASSYTTVCPALKGSTCNTSPAQKNYHNAAKLQTVPKSAAGLQCTTHRTIANIHALKSTDMHTCMHAPPPPPRALSCTCTLHCSCFHSVFTQANKRHYHLTRCFVKCPFLPMETNIVNPSPCYPPPPRMQEIIPLCLRRPC